MPQSYSGPYSYQSHTTSLDPSLPLPFGSPPAIGDRVVLFLTVFHPAADVFTVTDNYGNTWTLLKSSQTFGAMGAFAWSTVIAHTGAGFVATFAASTGTFYMSAAAAGSTPSVPDSFDGGSTNLGSSGTTATSGSYARLGTGDLDLFFATTLNGGQAWTAGTPANVLQSRAGANSQGSGFILAYQSGTAAGNLNDSASFSVDSNWVGIGVSFANFYLPLFSASPASVVSNNPLGTTVTLTGSHTAWTSGTTFSIAGVAGASILSQSVNVGAQTATLTIGTGSATGTLTITNTTDAATTTVGVAPQPVTITPEISTSGRVFSVSVQTGTPAANGQYGDVPVTAMASDPTVLVNGNSVVLGPRTWASTAKTSAFIDYLLPTVLLPTDVVTCSWSAGWFTTASGSPLAQAGVSVANYTGQDEPDFTVVKTMKVGINTGSQPSRSSGGNFLGKNLLKHAGAWIPGTNTTIFGLDSAGNPTSWTPGGFVIIWVNGSFDSNQVDAQGLPTLMGTYAAQYDDPQVGRAGAWNVDLIGNVSKVTITHLTTMVTGTTVTILWDVQYIANTSNLEPFLELTVQSAPGLFANPTQPNLWVFGPGSTIDRSDPLAASEPALSRFTSARGRTPEWLRSMDVDGGGFGEIDNMPFAADLIDANHASWDYGRAISTAALPAPTMRPCNFDPAKGPGGDGTYAWVTTKFYGDPTQSCYVQGPDAFGYYEPIGPTDAGSSVFPPQNGAQGHCVFELDWGQPHGLVYGYALSISQVRYNVSGVTNNGAGLIRIATTTVHPFVTGQLVRVLSVGGVTAANGIWTVTVIDANHFDLQGTAFAGSYTSGGQCVTAMPLQQSQSVGITNIGNAIGLITGPNTAMFTVSNGGTATPSTKPLTISGTVPLPCQIFISGTAPHDTGNVPPEFSAALAAKLGSKQWVNLQLKGTVGAHQEVARRKASRTPYGGTMLVEVGNEIWNTGFPDSQECSRLAVVASYLPTGTKLWGGKYTVTNGVSVPGALTGVYPLIAAAVMDTFEDELIAIGRSDIVVKRVLGSHFGSPSFTQSALATCIAYGLSFDYVAVAPYPNMGSPTSGVAPDAPFVAAFANGSGWTIAALCDLLKHYFYHETNSQANWAAHAGYIAAAAPSLPGGAAPQLICYEAFPQELQVNDNRPQLHDVLAHPLMWNVMTAFLYMCQRGQPTVDNSGAVGTILYQGLTVPGNYPSASFMLLAGLYQRPGYGLSNRFATAAGGAPADGKSHYGPSWTGGVQDFDGNESPGHQAVLDWVDATGTPPTGLAGPIDVVSDIGTLIVADDPEPIEEVDPDAGTLIIV